MLLVSSSLNSVSRKGGKRGFKIEISTGLQQVYTGSMKRRLYEYCEEYTRGESNEDVLLKVLNDPKLPIQELRTALMYLLKDARELHAYKEHVWYLRRFRRKGER